MSLRITLYTSPFGGGLRGRTKEGYPEQKQIKISDLEDLRKNTCNFSAIFQSERFDFKKYFLHLSPVTNVLR